MINVILLIFMFLFLFVYFFFYLKKKEKFGESLEHSLEDIGINELIKRKDTYDDTANVISFDLNKFDITSPDLDTYLNNILINRQLIEKKNNNDLPLMTDNNKSNYNHKLKLLINSRKISQNVVLNVLKNKINYLMGTLKNVKDIKKNITD